MYYPDRVMRQFGLTQSIPSTIPDFHIALHNNDRRGRTGTNWASFHATYIRWLNSRINHVVSTPWGGPDMDPAYMGWYEWITRRLITPGLSMTTGYQPLPNAYEEIMEQTIENMYQLSIGEVGYIREPARRSFEDLYDNARPYIHDRRPSFHQSHSVHEPIPEHVHEPYQSPPTQHHHDPQPTMSDRGQTRRRRSSSSHTTQSNTPCNVAGLSTTAFVENYGVDMPASYFVPPQVNQQESTGSYWNFTSYNQSFTDLLQANQYSNEISYAPGESTHAFQQSNFNLTPVPFSLYETGMSMYEDNTRVNPGSSSSGRPTFDLNIDAKNIDQLHTSDSDSYSQQDNGRGKRKIIRRRCGTGGYYH